MASVACPVLAVLSLVFTTHSCKEHVWGSPDKQGVSSVKTFNHMGISFFYE